MIFRKISLWWLVIFPLLNTCAGTVEDLADCPLSCADAINATTGISVTPITTSVTISCAGGAKPGPVEALFLFEGDSKTPTGDDVTNVRAGIAFRPVYYGSYDTTRNDQTEAEYKGIVTPKGNWCSNECGVGRIKFWAECVQYEQLTHAMHLTSGSVFSASITITADGGEKEEE